MFEKLGALLTETPDQSRAQEIRRICRGIAVVQQIAECRPRTKAKVVGLVESIKFDPGETYPRLEVRIYDGTDEIVAIWFGRKQIRGIRLGMPLLLMGTTVGAPGGKLQMMNPYYDLVGMR